MTNAQLRNLAIFVAAVVANIAAISLAAALAGDTMPGFRPGEFFAPGKAEAVGLLAILVPVLSGYVVQNRPRFGSERLAAEVDKQRKRGYKRSQLTVVPKGAPATSLADLAAWHPVVHTTCGKAAFLTVAPTVPGETVGKGEAVHTDGRPYDVDGNPRCDGCGKALGAAYPHDGVWVAVDKEARP